MTSLAIILFLGLCLTVADSRHSGPLQQNNGVPGAQVDLIEQLKQEMLEQIQVQAGKYDLKIMGLAEKHEQQIKEQAEKHEQQITELKTEYVNIKRYDEISVWNKAIQSEINEIKRDNAAKLAENTKLRELLDGHSKRLVKLEDDIATSGDRDNDILTIPAEDNWIFTNFSSYNPAFQARCTGFTGTQDAQIPFELVDVNIGDAYDPSGLFTAPVAGIYQIGYEVMADGSCGTDHTCVYVTVNGVYTMKSCSVDVASGGSSMILQLVVGDTVSLNIAGPCHSLYNYPGTLAYNQFSGNLLYEVL